MPLNFPLSSLSVFSYNKYLAAETRAVVLKCREGKIKLTSFN